MDKKYFRISSALKDIIGKDLITDEFVAIFELVKNSFDANAKRVDVIFDQIVSGNSQIIIKDNGKGMDLQDIEEKWLFVAYSAKKEGTEDYRDEIQTNRVHAGAKGIGRFSCDRLGKELTIYSRRNPRDKISKLIVDWEEFERDIHNKFDKISVSFELVDECNYSLDTGTILEIRNVRSTWDIHKLRKLRQSLEKLINPAQSNVEVPFSIYLKANDFKEIDKGLKDTGDEHLIVNGKIKNFLFEKLDLKTTKIQVDINEAGTLITTELYDRGNFVYRMIEDNPYHIDDLFLSNISVHLFSLNKTSKAMFSKYMGVRPVHFGSVFVYKNGFRIHPIGEIGRGDVFGLDNRKQQGTSRFFGTRDLIGRIEINGNNESFKEASSRDGGLERNLAFDLLKDFFIENVVKRLERFAINVVKYGSIDNLDINDLNSEFPKAKALEFIEALTKSEGIHDIEFNANFFDILSNASEKSLSSLLKNLKRIAGDTNSVALDSEIEKIENRLRDLSKATKDAESEAKLEKSKRKEAEKLARKEAEKAKAAEAQAQEERNKTKLVTNQSMFLRSMVTTDLQNVVALHHHIGIAAGTIENYVRGVSKKIRAGKPMTSESFLSVLDEISFVARQISATTKFATKANFNLEAEVIKKDLSGYIEEYIINICSGLVKVDKNFSRNIEFYWEKSGDKDEFINSFRPLEIAMVLDSLINNSVKAGAKKIWFSSNIFKDKLIITIKDDGKGIKSSIRDKIFEMGFTTTRGSGLGLHHVKSIISKMKGDITLSDDKSNGAIFIISFSR